MATERARRGSVFLRDDAPATRVPLTRDRIVEEAIALLDEEGDEGLTMRRLASRLEAGPTTLYWHVTTRTDLMDLALDSIVGEVSFPQEATTWRTAARELLIGWRRALVRHPWTAGLMGRPMIGPNSLARMEFLQASLAQGPLDAKAVAQVAWSLYSQVVGSAAAEATFALSPEERDAAVALIRDQDDVYPHLATNVHALTADWEATFLAGVDYLFDGAAGADGKPRSRTR